MEVRRVENVRQAHAHSALVGHETHVAAGRAAERRARRRRQLARLQLVPILAALEARVSRTRAERAETRTQRQLAGRLLPLQLLQEEYACARNQSPVR